MPNIAIAILAAGSSSRMGQAKQLMLFEGQSLVQRSIDAAFATGCEPIFLIVSTSQFDEIGNQLVLPNQVRLVANANSVEGMASSIRAAVENAQTVKGLDALLFMNCDQPRLDTPALLKLINLYESGKIVAARFDGLFGSPAIFDRAFFPELFELKGDVGAKSIIRLHEQSVLACDLIEASFDVDTPHDYESLVKNYSTKF